jgi:ribonucleoside-diphosphate reductase alpha chain
MFDKYIFSETSRILTNKGYLCIKDCLDQNDLQFYNGKNFVNCYISSVGKIKLYKITLSNGIEIECSLDCKWNIIENMNPNHYLINYNSVKTQNLKENDIINSNNIMKNIDLEDPDEFLNPYIHGYYSIGSLPFDEDEIIRLDSKSYVLLNFFNPLKITKINRIIEFSVKNKINKNKFFVPINYSVKTKLEWIAGIIDCISFSNNNNNTKYILIYSHNLEYIKDIQLLLSTLGINTYIQFNKNLGINFYVIIITLDIINYLLELGLKCKITIFSNDKNKIKQKLITISKIEEMYYDVDSYKIFSFYFTKIIANGIFFSI